MTIDLPRSVLAAIWVGSLRRDPGSVPRAVAAVQGEDEPHTCDDGGALSQLLDELAARRGTVLAVLPTPGEPFTLGDDGGAAAMDAGEALVVPTGPGQGPGLVAVPQVTEFGSHLEPGAMVRWRLFRQVATAGVVDSPAEARRGLAEALRLAIDALTAMDVARWREEAAEEIAMLASPVLPPSLEVRLPEGLDDRRVDLLARAARLRAIVALAAADDGAAVNAWQADQRSAALRHVASAARRAMTAASASNG